MRILLPALVSAGLVLCPSAASAQQKNSSVFVGGVYSRNITEHLSGSGWNAEFATYATKHFGLVASASGVYGKFLDVIDLSTYSVLVGPQFRFPNTSRVTPFVRVVGGGARASAGFLDVSASVNGWGVGGGGGADITITPVIAVRAVQFDYGWFFAEGQRTSGISFSAGIVFRF